MSCTLFHTWIIRGERTQYDRTKLNGGDKWWFDEAGFRKWVSENAYIWDKFVVLKWTVSPEHDVYFVPRVLDSRDIASVKSEFKASEKIVLKCYYESEAEGLQYYQYPEDALHHSVETLRLDFSDLQQSRWPGWARQHARPTRWFRDRRTPHARLGGRGRARSGLHLTPALCGSGGEYSR